MAGIEAAPRGGTMTVDMGCEAGLWEAVDALRGGMDVAEYRQAVLGLVFLRHISDAFDGRCAGPAAARGRGAGPEDPDRRLAGGVFRVPPEACWERLKAQARQGGVGRLVDDAMSGVERGNPALEDVPPKGYARSALGEERLGRLIGLVSDIRADGAEGQTVDALGCVYGDLLSRFADQEGRRGGGFHTPRCVARLLVEMLEPRGGRIYDPCCGSSGMLVESMEFIRAHGGAGGGKVGASVTVFGQELDRATWRLARMNLAIRGVEGRIAHGDTLRDDRHPGLRADFVLASPPFNVSGWGVGPLRGDVRWRFGVPPDGNTNFAWLQHIHHHLAPGGAAGVVLANGSMSSQTPSERGIRRAMVEGDVVDCMVALPGQLLHSTQVPACLWLLARDKSPGGRLRDRRGEVLFIDARLLGRMVDNTRRELGDGDIGRIASTYRAWRGGPDAGGYEDVQGFCRSATLEEIGGHGHVLAPGRYVGVPPQGDGGEPFEDEMRRLVARLGEQRAEGARLDAGIARSLKRLGHRSWDRHVHR